MKKKDKKLFPLRYKLPLIVGMCWFIPLILIVSLLAHNIEQNMQTSLEEDFSKTVSHASQITSLTIDNMVNASRNASYDKVISQAYRSFEDDPGSGLLAERTNRYLTSQYRYDKNFKATFIFYAENPDKIYYTFNPKIGSYSDYADYQNKGHDYAVSKALDLGTSMGFVTVDDHLYMVRNIVDSKFNTFATLVMDVDAESVFSPITDLSWQDGVLIQLENSRVLFSEDKEGLTPKEIDYVGSLPHQYNQVSYYVYDSKPIFYGIQSSDTIPFVYTIKGGEFSILQQFTNYTTLITMVSVVTFALFAYLFYFTYTNIFDPISHLAKSARKIEDGDYGYQIDYEPINTEFDYLTRSVNHMSDKLKEQFERIYSEELALRDAQIMALQSQINPHFLNNTLEFINWEARMSQNETITNMIEALSVMLNAATVRTSSPFIPLKEELDYVESYLYILSQRFGSRLSVTQSIDESLLSEMVPLLIMQPIIENAVEHGMPGIDNCLITIDIAKIDDKNMQILIKNNAPLSKVNQKTINALLTNSKPSDKYVSKTGIYNVNSRLRIIYGDAGGLNIYSTENDTVAKMVIPLNHQS